MGDGNKRRYVKARYAFEYASYKIVRISNCIKNAPST
jgi:hypothetical protein